MSTRRASRALAAHRRLAWMLFAVVSVLGIVGGSVAASVMGDRTDVAMVVLAGLIIVGMGAALLASISSSPSARFSGATARSGAGAGAAGIGGGDGGSCG